MNVTFQRAMIINTSHGGISTPVFMPVGTNATVKSLSPDELEQIGAQVILANSYHLHLRPGAAIIHSLGGLHQFMNWPHPILTDSGGFQVFSLGHQAGHAPLVKIKEDGIKFRSHLDGSTHFWTPEDAIRHQFLLGADIIMPLDVATPHHASYQQAKSAMEITHKWLLRCVSEWQKLTTSRPQSAPPLLFGIIQGGYHRDLRRQSAEFVTTLGLPGTALGGESIGYHLNETIEIIHWVRDLLPKDKPLYTMGLGAKPSDLQRAFAAGVDMADCVAPARLARHGLLYVSSDISPSQTINIAKSIFQTDPNPIDPSCHCPTCAKYSKAYLHHLFKARELLYYRLATTHNLTVMIKTAQSLTPTPSKVTPAPLPNSSAQTQIPDVLAPS